MRCAPWALGFVIFLSFHGFTRGIELYPMRARPLPQEEKPKAASKEPDQEALIEQGRKEWYEKRLQEIEKQAGSSWKKTRTPGALILQRGESKNPPHVLDHAKSIRAWLDKTFKDLGGNEVLPIVIRSCATEAEAQAFNKDRENAAGRLETEIAFSPSGGIGLVSDYEFVASRVVTHWFGQKHPALLRVLPYWARLGLDSYVSGARTTIVHGFVFAPSLSDWRDCAQLARANQLIPTFDLTTRPLSDLGQGRAGGESEVQAEMNLFVRYLLEDEGKKGRTANVLQNYCKQVLEKLEAEDRKSWAATRASKESKGETIGAAEFLEELNRRRTARYSFENSPERERFFEDLHLEVFKKIPPAEWLKVDASFKKTILAGPGN